MFENAVSQPARAVLTGEMSNPCSETANSTSDSKRHCARIGLGIRIPSEFPILMIDAFMDSQSNYRSGSSNSFHPIGGAGGEEYSEISMGGQEARAELELGVPSGCLGLRPFLEIA